MSGHSHFKNIKRKKEVVDQKKASAFSRISRLIISSVREKGKDPQSNPSLRVAMAKAREADMPKERIEKAIKRGAGEGEEKQLEPFDFEAYGPEGTAIIIEGSTDNKRRTLANIKEILKRFNGKMANPGAVKWLFERKGIIEASKNEMCLYALDAGAEDIEEKDDVCVIYTLPENVEKIKKEMEDKTEILSSSVGWTPKAMIETKISAEDITAALEEEESVEKIYLNIR